MIKVFKDWKDVPSNFSGVLCVEQEICSFKKGYYFSRDNKPVIEYRNGETNGHANNS